MYKKLVSAVLIAVFVVVSVAGCSKGTDQSKNTDEAVVSEKTEAPQKEVKLSLFSKETLMREDYERMFAAVKKNYPHITVETSIAPTSEYPQLLKTKVASGDGPDLFTLWPGLSYVVYYAKNGHLLELSDREWVKNVPQNALQTVVYEDKVYAQPLTSNVIGVVYDKRVFKQMNLSIPRTWEEFLKLCETIKKAGKIPIAMPAKTDWPPQFLPIYAFPNNLVHSVDPEFNDKLYDGKVTFSQSDYKKGFEMFMDLNSKGYFNPSPLGVTYEQSQELHAKGDIVLAIQGNWYVALVKKLDPDFDAGMFPVPAPEGYKTTVPVGGNLCNVIYSKTAHKEEALTVLDFMATQEAFDLSNYLGEYLTPLKNVKTKVPPLYDEEILPAAEKSSYPFTNIVWVPGIQEAFQKGYQELFAGVKNIEEILADVDKVAERNIKSFKENE